VSRCVDAGPVGAQIAEMFAAKEESLRKLIKTFNDRGFASLDPKARRGSMPRIGPSMREQICRTATSDPGPAGPPVHLLELDQAARLPGREQVHPG
jgi:hypothetical protein